MSFGDLLWGLGVMATVVLWGLYLGRNRQAHERRARATAANPDASARFWRRRFWDWLLFG